MPRTLLAALLAVMLTAACAASASAADQATTPEGVPVPELDWRDCDDGFQCATASVPRDYARPDGATVDLALVRRPAADPERRIGTLFLNPGGPGGSGVEFVRTAPPGAFQLLGRFDWVGFDPRGVGDSEPAVDCDEPAEPYTSMTPDTLDVQRLLRHARESARLCQNRPPAFLRSLTTANVARDLDVLRAAVGDRKLTYLGVSWGGMLGETYASLFPGRARALLLDSPVDGDVWLNQPLESNREQLVGFEVSLGRFFSACAAAGERCPFGAGAPGDAYDDLLARLDAAPLDLGDGRTVDAAAIRGFAVESLYGKAAWRRFADVLAAVDAGDGARVRQLVDAQGPLFDDLLLEAFDSYLGAEQRHPRRVATYLDHGDHAFALTPHFAFGTYESVSGRFWPFTPRSAFYGPYRHARNATPALVLHTTHDPATPYAWGRRVLRDLGNARMLTYRGDGHGVVTDLNPCVLQHTVAYLEDLRLPPAGAVCVQGLDPFAVARSAAQARRWRAY